MLPKMDEAVYESKLKDVQDTRQTQMDENIFEMIEGSDEEQEEREIMQTMSGLR